MEGHSSTAAAAQPSPTARRHLRDVQLSTTRCYPCKYSECPAPEQPNLCNSLQHLAMDPAWRTASFTSVGGNCAKSFLEVSGMTPGDPHSPSYMSGDNFLSARKGHEAQYCPSKRSLRSSPKFNHSIFVCFNPERLSTTPHPSQSLGALFPLLTFHEESGFNWGSLKRCNGV